MQITINGESRDLVGNPPAVDEDVPHFKVFNANNDKVKTREFFGKPTLISVVPSITTSVCSIQTKKFNQQMDEYPNSNFVTISMDTPEQQADWCAAEGVQNMQLLSDSEQSFGYALKVLIPDESFLARSIFVLDADGKITYEEVVHKLTDEPDYAAALAALEKLL